jgi:hypothetical protein
MYPPNIQSDTDSTQYLIALKHKRSELHMKCEAAEANRLQAHLAREEEHGDAGQQKYDSDYVCESDIIEAAPAVKKFFSYNGKQYEYEWEYEAYW